MTRSLEPELSAPAAKKEYISPVLQEYGDIHQLIKSAARPGGIEAADDYNLDAGGS